MLAQGVPPDPTIDMLTRDASGSAVFGCTVKYRSDSRVFYSTRGFEDLP
jgi:hypothetical protein